MIYNDTILWCEKHSFDPCCLCRGVLPIDVPKSKASIAFAGSIDLQIFNIFNPNIEKNIEKPCKTSIFTCFSRAVHVLWSAFHRSRSCVVFRAFSTWASAGSTQRSPGRRRTWWIWGSTSRCWCRGQDGSRVKSSIWGFPWPWGYPKIDHPHFHGIVPNKNHPSWGSPIYGNPQNRWFLMESPSKIWMTGG